LTSVGILQSVAPKFPWAFRNARLIVCDGASASDRAWTTMKPDLLKRIHISRSLAEGGGRMLMYPVASTQPGLIAMPDLRVRPGITLHLLDHCFEPAPPGVPGELYIAGDGLALGYKNRVERTTENFTPNVISEIAGSRLCRTGERARLRVDGRIEFTGHNDGCITTQGIRVELEEVEHVLAQQPELADAGVIAEEPPGAHDLQLHAFVAPRGNSQPASEHLRAFLLELLPLEAVPARFTIVPEIPRSPEGQVNRSALKRIARLEDAGGQVKYVPPQNELQEQLAQIWAQTLNLERVGIHDNFFTIGGHSLLATQVMARISDVLHVQTPLRSLFEAPTIAGFAPVVEQIRQEQGTTTAEPTPAIKRLARKAVTLSQESR
jgi:hypothetical protein